MLRKRIGICLVLAYVAWGCKDVKVPNCVGMDRAAAEAAIEGAGLVVGTVTEVESDTIPSGQVTAQNPGAGVDAVPGSAVALTVSIGPDYSGLWLLESDDGWAEVLDLASDGTFEFLGCLGASGDDATWRVDAGEMVLGGEGDAVAFSIQSSTRMIASHNGEELELTRPDLSRDDHSDDMAGATTLTVGTAGGALLENSSDVDVFRFDAEAGFYYNVGVSFGEDVQMTVVDASGTVILSMGESCLDGGAFTASQTGYYFVKIENLTDITFCEVYLG